MIDDIKVSVCVVTYNQEKYIAECLDSLVSQETDFKFEIIVGEDCSTDGTRAIVQQYVDKYPDIVKPIFHKENVGAVENIKQVYLAAKGKYIAHMDGDDLALPTKLQKQFDTMEENPQAIICSHNVSEIVENTILKNGYWNHPKGEYVLLDLVKKLPFFAHSSKFFRVTDELNLSDILNEEDVLDIELHLYQSTKGTIIHVGENLGFYRSGVGVTSISDNKLNQNMIARIEKIYSDLLVSNPELAGTIKIAYASYLLGIANNYAVTDLNGRKMREYALKSIKQKLFSKRQLLMVVLCANYNLGVSILNIRYKFKHKKQIGKSKF